MKRKNTSTLARESCGTATTMESDTRAPCTRKITDCYANEQLCVGSSVMQGWRRTMEDEHKITLALPRLPGVAYFGVFDGHRGGKVSKFVVRHMQSVLEAELLRCENDDRESIANALKRTFVKIDDRMLREPFFTTKPAGSTANVLLIKGKQLFCANAGDSRAVASRNGGWAHNLSRDHKPDNPKEQRRIEKSGDFVHLGRINGNLAVSRGLGDFDFKSNPNRTRVKQSVTALPAVYTSTIYDTWDFVVMACDGIWDVMSSQDVIDYCQRRIGRGMLPPEICEALLDHCLAPDYKFAANGGDNMTVILICLLHGRPYEALVKKCAKDCARKDKRIGFVDKMPKKCNPQDEVLSDIFNSLDFKEKEEV